MAYISRITLPDGQTYNLRGDGTSVICDTSANWATKTTLKSQLGYIYVWTDYQTSDNTDIPGIKIGDGQAYVLDLPFVDTIYAQHIADTIAHVTQTDRNNWDSKVTCYIDPNLSTRLCFSTENMLFTNVNNSLDSINGEVI